jgi:spore germination protein GerM
VTRLRVALIGAAVLLLVMIGWAINRGLTRLDGVAPGAGAVVVEPAAPPTAVRHITATLFYGSADGESLVPVQQEIVLEEGIVPQGREILSAQLQPPPAPQVSVIPQGTTLRAFYVTDRGDAFVDLSADVSSKHPGGSSAELLTVYAVVNAVTANLPTIRRVQILIEGQEADTLAGHIDLRSPLERDITIVSKP